MAHIYALTHTLNVITAQVYKLNIISVQREQHIVVHCI